MTPRWSPGASRSRRTGVLARQPFGRLAVLLALVTAAAIEPAASVDGTTCLELERQFEVVSRDVSSVQINEALFRACSKGCAPLARRLLAAGASVYARDRDGTMPLGYAAQFGQTALVDLLLEQGAPIDARNLTGSTALYAAAESDRAAVVGRLLARGADPNLAGRSGVSALAAAASRGTNLSSICCLQTVASRTRSTRPVNRRSFTPQRSASLRSFNACSTPVSISTRVTARTSRS